MHLHDCPACKGTGVCPVCSGTGQTLPGFIRGPVPLAPFDILGTIKRLVHEAYVGSGRWVSAEVQNPVLNFTLRPRMFAYAPVDPLDVPIPVDEPIVFANPSPA